MMPQVNLSTTKGPGVSPNRASVRLAISDP